MTKIAQAISWEFGDVADTAGDEIISWRHPYEPQPTKKQLNNIIERYENRCATIEEIKSEANRRIEDVIPIWMVVREFTGGKVIPNELKEFAESIRARSNELELNPPHGS